MLKRLFPLLWLSLILGTSLAQPPKEKESSPVATIPEPLLFETRHSGNFGGRAVDYLVRAGELHILDEQNQPSAAIFSFAYLEENLTNPATRPVTFLWNGGPGSSSIWLHLGAMGPRRARVPSEAEDAGAPPYQLEESESSLLDVTDLVFIDPVGTGFSQAVGEHENKEFWGLREDAESIAAFIRRWLTENQRWNSPKYLLGESFGTTRAAAVAGILEGSRPTVSLNGLILISQALDYTGSTPEADNLIAYLTYLPTMAATAWYHDQVDRGSRTLEEFLREVREFTIEEYAPVLIRGNQLSAATRQEIRRKLASITGLSEDYIEAADLRIRGSRFLKELLRRQGLAAGRLDSRYLGNDVDDLADVPEGDAARDAIYGAFTALFHDYLSRQLEIDVDRPYRISAGSDLRRNWRYRPVPDGQRWEPSYVNTAPDLSMALRKNRDLRVLVANGYYDFATPFFDAEYTFQRHGILSDRITMTYYEAGHMMYLHDPSRLRLAEDIRTFVRQTQNP